MSDQHKDYAIMGWFLILLMALIAFYSMSCTHAQELLECHQDLTSERIKNTVNIDVRTSLQARIEKCAIDQLDAETRLAECRDNFKVITEQNSNLWAIMKSCTHAPKPNKGLPPIENQEFKK